MLDKIVTALNRLNHGSMTLLLFLLGVGTAITGFIVISVFPGAEHDMKLGLAGLGAVIVGGAMMSFRSGTDSSQSEVDSDGTVKTKQSTASGDPTPPAI